MYLGNVFLNKELKVLKLGLHEYFSQSGFAGSALIPGWSALAGRKGFAS